MNKGMLTKNALNRDTLTSLLTSLTISLTSAGCFGIDNSGGNSKDAKVNAKDFPDYKTNVINGTQGLHEDFPSIIAMTYLGQEMCTGTLIKPDFILTAAHCVPYLEKAIYGYSDISEACDECVHDVFFAVKHASYNFNNNYLWKDVGWALLEKPIENAVTAEILPKEAFPQALEVGKMVTIVGYGENGVVESGNLFYGVVPITAFFTEEGPSSDPSSSIEEMVVGLDEPEAPNLCYGDSGGPTYIEVDGKEYLTGITSRVPPDMPVQCGHGAVVTLPGVFTDLTDERYSALLKCRDEGDCSDVYDGNIGGGDGEGGNGKGGSGAGGDEEGGSSNPITENHQEPFVMIEDTGCNYSGRLSNQPLGQSNNHYFNFILGAAGLAYALRRKKFGK